MTDQEFPRRTVLLDSSGVLHRCFHGYPPRMVNIDGQQVNISALQGYCDYVRRLMAEFPFERLVHILDPEQGSSYRLELYPQYKANRSPSDPALTAQKKLLPQVLAALGQSFIQMDGIESDDIIGVLAKRAAAEGDYVMVVSQDKDLLQLVDDNSTLMVRYVDRKGEDGKIHQQFDEAGVFHTMGVRPDQIADYLAIVGDSSDNIPGVKGAGPGTATKWLAEHGNLATLVTRCDTIKGKIGESLRECRENLWLYQKLTTLQCDLEGVEFPAACLPAADQYQFWRGHIGNKPGWELDYPAPEPKPAVAQGLRLR